MFKSYFKKCPRCNEKCAVTEKRCGYCGLVFERLQWATNKAGKKMLRQGKKDKVVYVKKYPSDVQKSQVVILCAFLGLVGGHYYYVGRLKKALFMTFFGLIAITFGILNSFSMIPDEIFLTSQVITAIPVFIWIFDLVNVSINRFKIPVSIDLTEEKWRQ